GDQFYEFLRKRLAGPEHEWKKAETAGDVLTRYMVIQKALQLLEANHWGRGGGGYKVPKGHGYFPGRTFVKEDIYKALRMTHSQAHTDLKLFSKDVLEKIPKIKAWVDNPEGSYNERFGKMSITNFRKYQEARMNQKKKDIGSSKAASSSKAAGKKRATSSGNESAEEMTPRRPSKKGRKRVDSSDLEDL
ncbi:hypothetical protein BD410DRAFT_121524, partial [Rickenella mellea]